jgi:hypothetical protein
MEKRHNFVRKVAETAVKCFIKDDKVSCVGLILAGSADFKTELNGSGKRLKDTKKQIDKLLILKSIKNARKTCSISDWLLRLSELLMYLTVAKTDSIRRSSLSRMIFQT